MLSEPSEKGGVCSTGLILQAGGHEEYKGPPSVSEVLLESFGPGQAQNLMPACEQPVLCMLLEDRSLLCYQFLAPPTSSSSSTALRLLRHSDSLLSFCGEQLLTSL